MTDSDTHAVRAAQHDDDARTPLELIAAYRAQPWLNWMNTLALETGVPGYRFSGSADLAGAFIYEIHARYGHSAYARFWRYLGQLPTAWSAPEAVRNFQAAAFQATGDDFSWLLYNAPEPGTVR